MSKASPLLIIICLAQMLFRAYNADWNCDRSFTGPNSDIPIPETGYTMMGSYTVPCDLFLSVAHSYLESEGSLSQHLTSQPASTPSLTCGDNCPIDNHDWTYPTAPAGYTNVLYPSAPSAFFTDASVFSENRVLCSGLYSSHASRVTYTSIHNGYTEANRTVEIPVTYAETISTLVLTSSIKPPAGCCGPCLLLADAVRLLYWPPELSSVNASITAAPSIPYSYISGGVTFISPSVYVAYQNLGTSRECDPFEAAWVTYNTTLAYAPDALSTKHCIDGGPTPVWKRINYTEMLHPPPNSLVSDCHFFAGLDLSPASHDVAASPWFSIPLDITTVNPAFKSCSIWYNGAWDPPRTLEKGSAMVPSSSNFDPPPASTAAPGAQVTPTLAPATTIVPMHGPSQSPLADPKEPAPASATEHGPRIGDPEKSMDPSEPPTETQVPPGTIRLPLPSPQTKATSAAAPAAGAVAPQPSNDDSRQSSDPPSNSPATGFVASQPSDGNPSQLSHPPQNPPIEAAKTSGPAVLVAPPKADNPSDPKMKGAPPGQIMLTTSASSPGGESSVPVAVGYLPILVSGHPIATDPNGGIVVASSTIPVGGQATIYGHVVSAGSSGVIIDSNTYALPISATPFQSPILDPNAQSSNNGASPPSTTMLPFTRASNGDVVIASSTIAVGNQAAIDGHVFSVGISSVAVDGIPYSPPSQTPQNPSPVPTPVLISGNLISTGQNGDIVIASSTIAVGNQATIYGHVVSAGSSDIVVDGSTYARSFGAGVLPQQIGSSVSDLASTMAGVVTGSSVGMGGLIMSGFGAAPSPTSAGSAAIGSSTLSFSVNLASGSNMPTFTGGSAKAGIDVRLMSFTVIVNAIGVTLAFL